MRGWHPQAVSQLRSFCTCSWVTVEEEVDLLDALHRVVHGARRIPSDRVAKEVHSNHNFFAFVLLDPTHPVLAVPEARRDVRSVGAFVVVWVESDEHDRPMLEVSIELTEPLVVTRRVVLLVLVFVNLDNDDVGTEIAKHVGSSRACAIGRRKVVALVTHPSHIGKRGLHILDDVLLFDLVVSGHRLLREQSHEVLHAVSAVPPIWSFCEDVATMSLTNESEIARASTFFALGSLTLVFADPRASTFDAIGSSTLVFADPRASTFDALLSSTPVFADPRASTFDALGSNTLVFADPRASTFDALASLTPVFAERRASTFDALGSLTLVFADPRASTFDALGSLTLVFADPRASTFDALGSLTLVFAFLPDAWHFRVVTAYVVITRSLSESLKNGIDQH